MTSGLLARKGEARPSAEQNLATVLRSPTYRPPEQQAPIGPADLEHDAAGDLDVTFDTLEPIADSKVRIEDAFAMWPSKKPAPPAPGAEDEIWKLDQRLGLPSASRHSERTSVRFTHAQARALRLAALLLDRPQQELIEAGIEGKLQDLACTDLANCSCFQTVMATLQKR